MAFIAPGKVIAIVKETGIERHFREEEEKAVGWECICGLIPHHSYCRVWNRRKRQEKEAANVEETR